MAVDVLDDTEVHKMLKLGFVFVFCCRDDSSFRLNSLGPLCFCQCLIRLTALTVIDICNLRLHKLRIIFNDTCCAMIALTIPDMQRRNELCVDQILLPPT